MAARTLTAMRAGPPLRIRGITIVPIEHASITVDCKGGRILANADKHPAGIVVVDGPDARAFDAAGQPLELADLLEHVPGLRDIL